MTESFRVATLVSIGRVHVVQRAKHGPIIQHSHKLIHMSSTLMVKCSKFKRFCAKTPLSHRCGPLKIVCSCPRLQTTIKPMSPLLLCCCFSSTLRKSLQVVFPRWPDSRCVCHQAHHLGTHVYRYHFWSLVNLTFCVLLLAVLSRSL